MFLKIAKNSSGDISVKVMSESSGKEMKTIKDNGHEELIHELVFNGKHELDRLIRRHRVPDTRRDCITEQSLTKCTYFVIDWQKIAFCINLWFQLNFEGNLLWQTLEVKE